MSMKQIVFDAAVAKLPPEKHESATIAITNALAPKYGDMKKHPDFDNRYGAAAKDFHADLAAEIEKAAPARTPARVPKDKAAKTTRKPKKG